MGDDIKTLIARSDRLIENKRIYEPLHREIRDFLYPDGPAPSVQESEAARNRDRIVTNRGENILDEATATVFGLLCNPAMMWKQWIPQDPDLAKVHEVRDALEQANDLSFRAVYHNPRTRFAVSALQGVREFLALGTMCQYVAGRPGDLPLFACRPLAQIAAAENDDFEADSFVWRFQMTAHQVLRRWPDYPGQKVRDLEKNPDTCYQKVWVRHCVWPRDGYDPQSDRPEHLAFAEYWLVEEDQVLAKAEGGFYEQPYILAREGQRPGEIFGRGRGGKSLDDLKMLQRMRRVRIQSSETIVRPPMIRPDDASVNSGGKLLLRPGWENVARPEFFMRGIDPVRPIITNARVDVAREEEELLIQEIGTPFLRQVMQLPREPRMPTEHVLALEEEAMRVASPLVEILQAEWLAPIDARLFNIMKRDGAFTEIFQTLGVPVALKAEFQSPASRVMRLKWARAASQRRTLFAPLFQVKPELLDIEDFVTAYRETGDVLGVPARWDFPPEKFEEMQAARRKVDEGREQREVVKDVSVVAKNAAPLMQAMQQQQQQQGA